MHLNVATLAGGGPVATEFWLNEAQALLVHVRQCGASALH
jgi:hypothetical protein